MSIRGHEREGRASTKRRRDEERGALGSRSCNTSVGLVSNAAEDDAPPRARLSRHIPQREEMNMAISGFNLTTKVVGGGGCFSQSDASFVSCAESCHSDDSSFVSSMYCERLADTLTDGVPDMKLGGDVLRFRSEKVLKDTTVARIDAARLQHHTSNRHAANKPLQRVLNFNPDRVLDAPELPSFPSAQLLHWGTNNKLIIGLRSTLYTWDAETHQAQKALDVPSHLMIRCVQWVHRCVCIAITATDGTTAILDTKAGEYVRTLRPPEGTTVSQISIEGSMLAAGSNNNSGNIYLFDLRARDALVAQHEGHRGRISALQYCSNEPHYLASGGVDGTVRIWDARKPGCPRYTFSRVHNTAVTAVCWNPDRRTTLLSGGDDRNVLFLDSHATGASTQQPAGATPASGQSSDHRPYIIRSIATSHPITGIICPPSSGEFVTSHSGVGQLQLRKLSTFQSLGTFSAPNCEAGISCITLAPDRERVCAAQQDETLKFWKVFDASKDKQPDHRQNENSLFDEPLR